ncbi:MAG: enoyl-CoA hydratase/isomerase family protein [Dehalococcoidia bacterium]|nr:MAG: enoyl-CoA hydratase/isomerase family protein [Dehalococcoidia bacterium]
MEFTNIVYEKKDGLAKIVLNRPDVLNALDPKTLEEMYEAVEDIENDISVRVAVITATGRAFCTGADLTGIATIPPDKPRDYFLRLWNKVFSAVENMSVPVIAAVNGMAYAGGLELVMVCDLAIASEEAKLSDQHANRGLVPGGGASQRLPRLIGVRKAKELLYTGDRISPAEAERLGLINKVVPADKLEEATNELAQKLLAKSPMALKAVKKLVNRGMEGSLDSGLEMEMLAMTAHGTTEDFEEGVKSFLEGRPPAFPGR